MTGADPTVPTGEACEEALPGILRREEIVAERLSRAPATLDLSAAAVRDFRRLILDHHAACGRHDLPWRQTRDPYAILVSEVMLQQTQVPRVRVAYPAFLARFPNVFVLADATLPDVLEQWRGLGYNRRALSLKRAAELVAAGYDGEFPRTLEQLDALPGVGRATAAAVLASAFGVAVPYIETNIRAVMLHFFFRDACDVADASVLPAVERTLDRKDPRTWYYALMDYGNWLKRREVNPCRRSRHHATQAQYRGSMREVRGTVLRTLVDGGPRTAGELADETGMPAEKVEKAVTAMAREGLLSAEGERYLVR